MEDYKRRQMGRSMFPVTANQVVHAQHFEVLMKRMASSDTTSYECDSSPSAADIGYLDFFGDDKDMFRLLLVEGSYNFYCAVIFCIFAIIIDHIKKFP